MSLVRGIHASPMKQKLFRSFTTLCHDCSRSRSSPRGVEVAEERDDRLSTLGGDLYQGYLFKRPSAGFPTPVFPQVRAPLPAVLRHYLASASFVLALKALQPKAVGLGVLRRPLRASAELGPS